MAKNNIFVYRKKSTKKRKNVHSKNATKNQTKFKKPKRGQG